jgi:hypothetical protein
MRGVARTAVVAGTATAVSGRVQRRQAEKYASRDANIYAQREQAYEQQTQQQQQPPPPQQQPVYQQPVYQQPVYQQPVPPPPPAASAEDDMITKLKGLADLHQQGILTDDEFATAKARLLAG